MKRENELKDVNIGKRVAEEEIEGLKSYFLKTYLWEQIIKDDVDVIFGCKGSGKSALYGYLSTQEYELLSQNVYLLLAENPRGAVAFKDLATTPPQNEFEFKSIWKMYFCILMYQKLIDNNYNDARFREISEKLEDSNLVPRTSSFASLVKIVREYISKLIPSVEPNVSFSDQTGSLERIGIKISLNEPNTRQIEKGVVSIDYLLSQINECLKKKNENVWIVIDRLDAIFQEDFDLEATALRTLFQVYIDLQAYSNIRLIIFLRDDIWNRIIDKGFRETSHITKNATITWDKGSLYDMLMSRFEQNDVLIKNSNLAKYESISEKREKIFNIMFPQKTLENAEFTFDWIISKIKDGNNIATPRELIQLINTSIKNEIKILMQGQNNSESLLSINSLYEGLKDASKTKLDTLIAEYPSLKNFIYRLKKSKVRNDIEDLRLLWDCSKKDAIVIANNLIKVGFFKNETEDERNLQLYIPIIYRPALGIQYS